MSVLTPLSHGRLIRRCGTTRFGSTTTAEFDGLAYGIGQMCAIDGRGLD